MNNSITTRLKNKRCQVRNEGIRCNRSADIYAVQNGTLGGFELYACGRCYNAGMKNWLSYDYILLPKGWSIIKSLFKFKIKISYD